jgi:hypothetical protein
MTPAQQHAKKPIRRPWRLDPTRGVAKVISDEVRQAYIAKRAGMLVDACWSRGPGCNQRGTRQGA